METLSKTSITDYPRSLQGNIEFRAQLLKDCETDLILQQNVKELCRRDIIFWIDLFCWTKDPRRKIDILPFICYDYQRTYIKDIERAIDEQNDDLSDKSRDMGVSWMVLYVMEHKWTFESGSDFRVGSRKEEYVDQLNNIDTLLEKIRFNLKRQPRWLLPKDFEPDEHATYMRIRNTENGNTIIGESANPHFGSGGRRKAILLDEFAKWDKSVAEAAWTATADVTKCRIVVSTPVGSGNKFAQLSQGTKEKINKHSLHWTLHPHKADGAYYVDSFGNKVVLDDYRKAYPLWKKGVKIRSPWYDAEDERRSESDLAQEVDIDYLKSGHPFFNLTALAKQQVWEYIKRAHQGAPIPYGSYITAKLVDIDNKIEVRELVDEWLRIYELPVKDMQYVVSGDVAEGLEKGDESFMTVREKITRNVVACANGILGTDEFAINLQMVGKFYNNANVAPENNNHGHSVCQDLKKLDCDLYETTKVNEKTKQVSVVRAGWTTTPATRPKMLDQLEEEIRKNSVELRDEVLISQCKTFVKNPKTGKPEADGSFLDDGVMSCAIGGEVIKEKPYKAKEKQTHEKRKAMKRKRTEKRNAGYGY